MRKISASWAATRTPFRRETRSCWFPPSREDRNPELARILAVNPRRRLATGHGAVQRAGLLCCHVHQAAEGREFAGRAGYCGTPCKQEGLAPAAAEVHAAAVAATAGFRHPVFAAESLERG